MKVSARLTTRCHRPARGSDAPSRRTADPTVMAALALMRNVAVPISAGPDDAR
jgi:hypothetical protein